LTSFKTKKNSIDGNRSAVRVFIHPKKLEGNVKYSREYEKNVREGLTISYKTDCLQVPSSSSKCLQLTALVDPDDLPSHLEVF